MGPRTDVATAAPAARERSGRLLLAARMSLVANIGIVLTGGIVRVTGSGLGCPDWPTCEGTAIAPSLGADHGGWRAGVEFGNRLLTFVVLAAAIAVVVEVRRVRPADRTVVRLAWLLPAGVLGQALLGGITVLTGLSPLTVAGHFLASMGLIAVAVALVERLRAVAGSGDAAPPPSGRSTLTTATSAIVAVAAVVLVLGTLVTGAGPHSGDPSAARLPLDIRLMAIAHADAVWLLLGLTVATLIVARRDAPPPVVRALAVLLVLELAQGGVGYLQYALGIPPALVSLHVLGAAVLWMQVVRVRVLAGWVADA
jgi:heme a synthase